MKTRRPSWCSAVLTILIFADTSTIKPSVCQSDDDFQPSFNSRAFVSSLARNLGITGFYTNLYRGVKNTFYVPFFGRDEDDLSSNRLEPHPSYYQPYHTADGFFKPSSELTVEGADYEVPENVVNENQVITEAPFKGGHGIYIIPAPNLATTSTPKPIRQSLNFELVKSLPPKYKPSYVPYTRTTTTTRPRQVFSQIKSTPSYSVNYSKTPPSIHTNYSSVQTLPFKASPQVVPVYGVTVQPTVATTEVEDFFFTTARPPASNLVSQEPFTSTPDHKVYYLPRTTLPPRAEVKFLLPRENVESLPKKAQPVFGPVFRTTPRPDYATTTLPKLFVSSIPSPKYHKVNVHSFQSARKFDSLNSIPVYKDPLYKKDRGIVNPFATLQPRAQELSSSTINPIVQSLGEPRPPVKVTYKTYVPLSSLKFYPVFDKDEELDVIQPSASIPVTVSTLPDEDLKEEATVLDVEKVKPPKLVKEKENKSTQKVKNNETSVDIKVKGAKKEASKLVRVDGKSAKDRDSASDIYQIYKGELPFLRVTNLEKANLLSGLTLPGGSEISDLSSSGSAFEPDFMHDIVIFSTEKPYPMMRFGYSFKQKPNAKEEEEEEKKEETTTTRIQKELAELVAEIRRDQEQKKNLEYKPKPEEEVKSTVVTPVVETDIKETSSENTKKEKRESKSMLGRFYFDFGEDDAILLDYPKRSLE